ncbi:MAG: alpha/beta hydrolase, partial [Cyanobacteria bacterium P01_B01_bin.77]
MVEPESKESRKPQATHSDIRRVDSELATTDLHLRGHGERDRDVREDVLKHRSIADYSAEMCDLASALPRPLVVAGHSMGGLIALEMASKGWADAVILLNSSVPYGILPSTEDERTVAKMLMSSGAFWERVLRLDFSIQAEYGLNMLSLDDQRKVFDRLDAESGRAIFEIFFWMFDEEQNVVAARRSKYMYTDFNTLLIGAPNSVHIIFSAKL